MTTEDKLAAVGNAVKEPRKAKTSDKISEPIDPNAPTASSEPIQAGDPEPEVSSIYERLDPMDTPAAPEELEHKPVAHVVAEQHSHRASARSIGELMRFRRKKAIRR